MLSDGYHFLPPGRLAVFTMFLRHPLRNEAGIELVITIHQAGSRACVIPSAVSVRRTHLSTDG